MSMTLDEQKIVTGDKYDEWKLEQWKRAVCKKFPPDVLRKCFRMLHSPYWPTEGLQVCHEAEKLLTNDQYALYRKHLCDMWGNGFRVYSAPYEQRLEALCRVWWPERFEK